MKNILGICATAVLFIEVAIAQGINSSSEFQTLIDDHWAAQLESNPVFATSLGVRDYDGKLADVSLAAYDRETENAKRFLSQLEKIDRAALSGDNQVNFDLLALELENRIRAADFGGKYLVLTNRRGPHNSIVQLADRLPFFTKVDFESYLTRLEAAPVFLEQSTGRLRAGMETGWVQPCKPMEGFEKSIRYHVVDDVSKSVLMKPFGERPSTISKREWRKLKAKAEDVIEGKVIPAIAAFATFYETDYRPACREEIGASTFPDGDEYYQFRASTFTTTNMTPDDIHALGLSEVARIRGAMEDVIESVGFEDSFENFQLFLRTDERFYAKTAEELIAANSVVAKKIDGELPRLFTRLPRMPYTIKSIPEDIAESTTTAYYERPAGDGSRPGIYRVNTSKLETRPLFEVEALTLHESVPGHHFQLALAQELTLPNFRKYGGFTAFTEGWGLYAESLGLDVGFYEDPYSNFGRLSYEMWRACRLVVDTGMHAKGWSRDQGINYMKENTALSEHNITAEIDRYIAWPGQALAYKIGELKIQELRARATKQLGEDFDLRRFHDEVLSDGGVPLNVLEAKIDRWIEAEKDR